MQRTSSFSIRELERIVLSHDIAYLYELLDYDYADARVRRDVLVQWHATRD